MQANPTLCSAVQIPYISSHCHATIHVSSSGGNHADDPQEVLDVLSSSEVIQEAVSTYFNTIHQWFSFISRKRMNLGISLAGGGADLTLLFLAIKLITTPPPQSQSADKLPLYWTTKRFLCLLEAAGTTSIIYLQSQILIALYEYSHALYPSAYLSVGACVRYASLLGLPSYVEASTVIGPCTVSNSQLLRTSCFNASIYLKLWRFVVNKSVVDMD